MVNKKLSTVVPILFFYGIIIFIPTISKAEVDFNQRSYWGYRQIYEIFSSDIFKDWTKTDIIATTVMREIEGEMIFPGGAGLRLSMGLGIPMKESNLSFADTGTKLEPFRYSWTTKSILPYSDTDYATSTNVDSGYENTFSITIGGTLPLTVFSSALTGDWDNFNLRWGIFTRLWTADYALPLYYLKDHPAGVVKTKNNKPVPLHPTDYIKQQYFMDTYGISVRAGYTFSDNLFIHSDISYAGGPVLANVFYKNNCTTWLVDDSGTITDKKKTAEITGSNFFGVNTRLRYDPFGKWLGLSAGVNFEFRQFTFKEPTSFMFNLRPVTETSLMAYVGIYMRIG